MFLSFGVPNPIWFILFIRSSSKVSAISEHIVKKFYELVKAGIQAGSYTYLLAISELWDFLEFQIKKESFKTCLPLKGAASPKIT